MSDYSKGKIYKICSDDPDITDVYIGSTIQDLSKRFNGHRSNFNCYAETRPTFCSSFKLFHKYGLNKFHIEKLDDFPCESKKELLIREQFYICKFKCVNDRPSYETPECKRARHRAYGQNRTFTKEQREQQKIYNKAYKSVPEHKIKNKEYESVRRQKTKIYIVCECGSEVSNHCMLRHKRSKKHATLVEALQQQAQACP